MEQAGEVVGGVAALPLRAGQPIFRDMVIALAGDGYRLSAALSQFPDHSLFPLPLDANNVVAPEAASFLPGDLIGVTVVLGLPSAATSDAHAKCLHFSVDIRNYFHFACSSFEVESEEAEAQARAYPPLAKDLFPQGVLVIAVQGLPQPTTAGEDPGDVNSQPVFAGIPQQEQLILLVPNQAREQLALAMQRADQVFVSLLARNDGDSTYTGLYLLGLRRFIQSGSRTVLEWQRPHYDTWGTVGTLFIKRFNPHSHDPRTTQRSNLVRRRPSCKSCSSVRERLLPA